MKQCDWKILQQTCIAQDIYELTLQCDDKGAFAHFQPGQFLNLRVPNAKELFLPRPISIHMADIEAGTVVLQYAVVGEGTRALSKAKAGEIVSAVGTTGKGYPVKDSYQNIWLLGGGLGIPPLYSITQAMPNAKYHAFIGWRDAALVNSIERWEAVPNLTLHPFTDNGSQFQKGFAIQAMVERLQTEKPDVIFACGPLPMLRALKKDIPDDVECYISMEERMACGIGACLVCTCATIKNDQTHNRRVCVDGPVFPIREVVFR